MWGAISLGFWFTFPWWLAVLSIFSCTHCPSAFPLWKNVYSGLLSILKSEFFRCCVVYSFFFFSACSNYSIIYAQHITVYCSWHFISLRECKTFPSFILLHWYYCFKHVLYIYWELHQIVLYILLTLRHNWESSIRRRVHCIYLYFYSFHSSFSLMLLTQDSFHDYFFYLVNFLFF